MKFLSSSVGIFKVRFFATIGSITSKIDNKCSKNFPDTLHDGMLKILAI